MALVAHYNCDDDAASTAVDDSTTNHDGTADRNTEDFSTDSGKLGKAFNFNGTTDKIDLGACWIDQAAFSFAAWVNLDTKGGGGYGRLLTNGTTVIHCRNSTTQLGVSNNGASTSAYTHDALLAATNWNHVAFTRNADGDWQYYFNGQPAGGCVASYAGGAPSAIAEGTHLWLGGNAAADDTRGFDGLMDDVRFYSHVLTSAEVLALYLGGTGTTAELGATTPVWPDVADVLEGSGAFGYISEYTPALEADNVLAASGGTYHAPDAAEVISTAVFGANSGTAGTYDVSNVSEGNIKDGVSIGGVTGTYDPVTGNYTDPGEANVLAAVEYEFAGATQTGTYPSTNESKAAQLADDQAEVNTHTAEIKLGTTVLTGTDAGTYAMPGFSRIHTGM